MDRRAIAHAIAKVPFISWAIDRAAARKPTGLVRGRIAAAGDPQAARP